MRGRSAPSSRRVSVIDWPEMRSEYALIGPHESGTLTRPGQIGVAFSGHRAVPYEVDGRLATADIQPGAAVVSGAAGVRWLRVREYTDVLEIYPAPGLVAATAAEWTDGSVTGGRPGDLVSDAAIGEPDGAVLGIGSVLRQAHVAETGLSDITASTLAHRLVAHLLHRYAGLRPPRGAGSGRLGSSTIDRVAALVESRLGDALTLDMLAAEARLSPYHFNRAFRATTGLPPYAFVTARRMDRARLLLRTTDLPVEEIATAVGYNNLSHFRRVFRRMNGAVPSALRAEAPARAA